VEDDTSKVEFGGGTVVDRPTKILRRSGWGLIIVGALGLGIIAITIINSAGEKPDPEGVRWLVSAILWLLLLVAGGVLCFRKAQQTIAGKSKLALAGSLVSGAYLPFCGTMSIISRGNDPVSLLLTTGFTLMVLAYLVAIYLFARRALRAAAALMIVAGGLGIPLGIFAIIVGLAVMRARKE